MSEITDELKAEAARPRRGFLVAAAVASALAAIAYVFEEDIILSSGAMGYAFLLIVLIFLAAGLMFCYKNPRFGSRLLGYDVVLRDPAKKIKSDVQFSGGFKADTGADTKRMNSKRKQARYSRRKLAQVTREMQREKKTPPSVDGKGS